MDGVSCRYFVRLPLLSVLCVFLFACSANSKSDVAVSDAVGTWKSNLGGKMTFREGGGFSAKNISLGDTCYPADEWPKDGKRTSGTGKWEIGSPRDEGPGVRIQFKPDDEPVASCEIYSLFTGVEPKSEMYLFHDDGQGERYKHAQG